MGTLLKTLQPFQSTMPLFFRSAFAIDTAGSHYENWRQIVVSVDIYHRSPITGDLPNTNYPDKIKRRSLS
jgi:hypothetical protein